ncbi:thiosulfate oxidation carrier complex protein SoxZ [Sulfurovum sp. zt1-1]|uniref:Thiosulfate oxidation carrier complex protein SoxZ n=1 Tax=Sulfurovum zhangzhouensis TaxID=3019067 RepID=A0ABT7R0V9_9BACT|nr:thiosulfate oxidation carrier complex protein SoxZ [Sulfurovum zhangzhouensis]MDM5272734.1 thiosulfate oxidation carrier complex protein SoxZ [Sulfurovum zhangzhouensis]
MAEEKRRSMIKIKPKKYSVGDIINVDFIIIHPMDTGMQKDKKTGNIIPAKYIDNITFFLDGKPFTSMKVWETVSTNPYFSVNLKVPGEGKITVEYTDNTGEKGSQSKKLQPKG